MNKNRNLAVTFILSLGILFSSEPIVQASSINNVELETEISAVEGTRDISLLWKMNGKKFKIYRDQKLIFEGTGNSFKDLNLNPDQIYSYRLGAYNEQDQLVEISNLKTSTLSEEAQPSDAKQTTKNIIEANVGTNYVNLTWNKVEDKDGIYEIYRDQKLIATTSKLSYRDKTVEPDTSYTYEIVAKTDVTEQKKQELSEAANKKGLVLTQKEKEELFEQQQSFIRILHTNKEQSEKELKSKDIPKIKAISTNGDKKEINSLLATYDSTYFFRYTTFIPEKTVPNPLRPGTYLHGDYRGFNEFSNKYRTRADVYAGWLWGGNDIDLDRSVGESILYDDAAGTQVVDRGTASADGIRLTRDLQTSSKLMWRINHDVGAPFGAIYPNINYYYEGTQYSNGSFSVRGSHDKAPNHEFYWAVAYTDLPGKTIFQHTGGSYFNLIPGAPQTYFEVSM